MLCEYIWLDGGKTPSLRSKTMHLRGQEIPNSFKYGERICTRLDGDVAQTPLVDWLRSFLPLWRFDGSSTGQATGDKSECVLKPVFVCKDPNHRGTNLLVLCEVLDAHGRSVPSNTRHLARAAFETSLDQKPWCGFEQEYFLLTGKPSMMLGVPLDERGEPHPEKLEAQGPYYCGVGEGRIQGRDIVDQHMMLCIEAGLDVMGINCEVAPCQWEIQVGGPEVLALDAADQLWIVRWLLHRVTERYSTSKGCVLASFDPKPFPEWNGSGCHTNFSTEATRSMGGIADILDMCRRLSLRTAQHLSAYGEGIERRLTGQHETCSYKQFKTGTGDRTASVRIPIDVDKQGCGYFEDRRPNSNCDPYRVITALLETCCLHLGTSTEPVQLDFFSMYTGG